MRFGIYYTGINLEELLKGTFAFYCWLFKDCIVISQQKKRIKKLIMRREQGTLIKKPRNGKLHRMMHVYCNKNLIYSIAQNSRTKTLKQRKTKKSINLNLRYQRLLKFLPSIIVKDYYKKQLVFLKIMSLILNCLLMVGSRIRIYQLYNDRLNQRNIKNGFSNKTRMKSVNINSNNYPVAIHHNYHLIHHNSIELLNFINQPNLSTYVQIELHKKQNMRNKQMFVHFNHR